MHVAVQICGWVAALATLLAGVPQVVKLIRTRDSAGVSSWTYLFWTLTAVWWAAWGASIGAYPTLAVNVSCAPILATAFVLLRPNRHQWIFLAANLLVLPIAALTWPVSLVLIGSVFQLTLALPSAKLALAPHSDLSGVAVGTWWLLIGSNIFWTIFDIGIGYPATATVGILSSLMATVVIVRTHQYHQAAALYSKEPGGLPPGSSPQALGDVA